MLCCTPVLPKIELFSRAGQGWQGWSVCELLPTSTATTRTENQRHRPVYKPHRHPAIQTIPSFFPGTSIVIAHTPCSPHLLHLRSPALQGDRRTHARTISLPRPFPGDDIVRWALFMLHTGPHAQMIPWQRILLAGKPMFLTRMPSPISLPPLLVLIVLVSSIA